MFFGDNSWMSAVWSADDHKKKIPRGGSRDLCGRWWFAFDEDARVTCRTGRPVPAKWKVGAFWVVFSDLCFLLFFLNGKNNWRNDMFFFGGGFYYSYYIWFSRGSC